MKFQFFMVTDRYTHIKTLHADSLREACREHIKAWHSRASSCAVIMRAPDGKRCWCMMASITAFGSRATAS